MEAMTVIGLAGAGNVARAMGRLLQERGLRVAAVASRDPAHALAAAEFIGGGARPVSYADLPAYAENLLIAVADRAIPFVAETLAGAGMRAGVALHTCGTSGEEALAALAECCVSCGAIHPLQSIASPEQGVRDIPGAAFAISGSPPAVVLAESIATVLEGQVLRVPAGGRAAYHAAAVMASNYVVGLVDAAAMLMEGAGISRAEALRALGPLARTSLENALTTDPAKALTGPIARGDAATVRSHLKALEGAEEAVDALYRAAGLHVLELARARGLAGAAIEELRQLLKGDKA